MADNLYRDILHSLDEGFCIIDIINDADGKPADWRYLETNPAFEKQGDLPAATGRLCSELLGTPEDVWLDFYTGVAVTGKPAHLEKKHVKLNRWYDVHAYKVGGKDSRQVAVLFHDVTEQKMVDKALCNSEEKLRLATHAAGMYTWDLDIATNKIVFSGDVRGVIGLSYTEQDDFISRIDRYVVPEDGIQHREALQRTMRGGGDLHSETRVVNPETGDIIWMETHATLVCSDDGKPLRVVGIAHNITERKRAEEALRQNAEDLLNREKDALELIDGSTEGSWIVDCMTGTIQCSEKWAVRIGLDRVPEKDQLGYAFTIIHPDDQKNGNSIGYCMDTGLTRFDLEYRMKTVDRGYIWTQNKGKIVYDEQGAATKVYAATIDISERKQAEKVLLENEKRQAFLLKLSDALRPISEPVEIHAAVTRMALEHFGADRCYYCEIDGEDVIIRREASHGALPSVVGTYPLGSLPIQKSLIDAGLPFMVSDVKTTEMADEAFRQLCIQLEVISYLDIPVVKGGKPVGMLCVVQATPRDWTDSDAELAAEIAERTWAAVERAKAEATLREQAVQLSRVSDAIISTDSDFRILSWNKAAEEIYGWTEAEALGWNPDELFASEFVNATREEAARQLYAAGSMQTEALHTTRDGRRLFVLGSITLLKNPDGSIAGTLGVLRDITGHMRAEEALRESERKARELVAVLEEADKNKNQFISVLSHELRNPLAVIMASLSLLELSDKKEQISMAKDIVKNQVGQLCKLVDDLLDLTRINQNKIKLKNENINLVDLLKNAARDMNPKFIEKSVRLRTALTKGPVILSADPLRIAQCVVNLLENALKFTPEGGHVTLSLATESDEAVIRVKDNGIGIDSEFLKHIFTPFTQADTSLDRPNGGGLGLGLSIVEGIARLHGGSVTAFSDGIGKGSLLTFRLPVSAPAADTQRGTALKKNSGAYRILLIEDNRELTTVLRTMFELMGHEAYAARSGEEGIAKAREIKPDVVFCDIGLPGLSGYETAEFMKADADLADTFLVALSGYAGDREIEQAIESGFDRHLAKPIDMAALEKILFEIDSRGLHAGAGDPKGDEHTSFSLREG